MKEIKYNKKVKKKVYIYFGSVVMCLRNYLRIKEKKFMECVCVCAYVNYEIEILSINLDFFSANFSQTFFSIIIG